MEWMLLPLKRYFEFSGRSRRMEYWMFFLFQVLIWVAFTVISMVILGGAGLLASSSGDPASGGMMGALLSFGVLGIIMLVVYLGLLVPAIAVAVRRLHDTDRSGKWLLMMIVPYVLGYALVILGATGNSTGLAALGGLISLIGLVAALVLLVFMFLPGTAGPNRYGPDPKAGEHAATGASTY